MYLDNGDIDPDYLLENDLSNEEFVNASEKLVDRAYRKATEWSSAVRNEKSVEDVNRIAKEAAETAYILDRVVSDFFEAYGKLSDKQVEAVNAGRRAWSFVNEVGTQLKYAGKEAEEMEEGDFVLINGNNIDPFSEEFDQLDTYRSPHEYIEDLSGRVRISSFEVNKDADLDDVPEDDVIEF